MGRLIGIDYGSKRCGLAVTDPSCLIASPLATIGTTTLFTFFELYSKKEVVEGIVFGWPLLLNGQVGKTAQKVHQLIGQMKKRFPTPAYYLYDERLTSIIAEKGQRVAGFSLKKRRKKENLDAMSAAIILTSFLAHPDPQSLSFKPH